MTKPLVLSYAGCSTCKRALKWLAEHDVTVDVRPIVEKPPTASELAEWIPASEKPIRKWLNTSGQSYRAIGKEKVEAATDAELATWLTKDGRLVKRPVLVSGSTVIVGFDESAYESELSKNETDTFENGRGAKVHRRDHETRPRH